MKGFMLLPPGTTPGYRGVDRDPFTPLLLEEAMGPSRPLPQNPAIWEFYPPGWRRDAYRLYEGNAVQGRSMFDDLWLLSSREVASEIRHIIEPHLGPHEIVACQVWEVGSQPIRGEAVAAPTLGYDVAYLGGDYYSAVRSGLLHGNASPSLVAAYGSLLNAFGLFADVQPISDYLRRFRQVAPSEANSTFCIYWLSQT